MEEQNDKFCPQHSIIEKTRQDRYKDIESKYEALEERVSDIDRILLPKDTFWWSLGVCVGIFAFFFLSIMTIREKIAEEKSTYALRSDLDKKIADLQHLMLRELDQKEDAHAGIHDYPQNFRSYRKD